MGTQTETDGGTSTKLEQALDELDVVLARAKSLGFDIDQSEQVAKLEEIGIPMPVDDIFGKPAFQADGKTPITINLVGSLSKRYRKVQAIQRGKVLRSVTKNAAESETDEELGERSLNEQTEAVAACITGWSQGFTTKGRDFPYSESNAVRLLKANPHIQRKAEKWMDEHARFFAQSSTDSPQ